MFYEKLYYTKSLYLVNFLVKHGHDIVKVKRDMNSEVTVFFYFEDSDELQGLVKEYTETTLKQRIEEMQKGLWKPVNNE